MWILAISGLSCEPITAEKNVVNSCFVYVEFIGAQNRTCSLLSVALGVSPLTGAPSALQWTLDAGSQFSSVQFSCSVASNSLQPHESQHARPPHPSQTPGVYPNTCPLSRWCRPAISSSVVPFSSCPQSLPASGSFPMSQLFASGGQSIGVSASATVLPMSAQDSSALGWTGWISLQSKGLSRVFSNTTGQKHQFFLTQALKTLLIHLKQVSFYFNMSKYVAFSSTCYIIFLWKEFGLSW